MLQQLQMLRKKLINAVEFQYFEKGRLLLMEGHTSLSMFFLISGEVLISKLVFDTKEKKTLNQPVNLLSSGDHFGHVGLIYNIARNASASTQSRLTMNSLLYFMRFFLSVVGTWLQPCFDLLNRCLLLLFSIQKKNSARVGKT